MEWLIIISIQAVIGIVLFLAYQQLKQTPTSQQPSVKHLEEQINSLQSGIEEIKKQVSIRAEVMQQQALLDVGQAVAAMNAPDDLEHVVQTCLKGTRTVCDRIDGISIQRIADLEAESFKSWAATPDNSYAVEFVSPYLMKVHREGKPFYRPDLDTDPLKISNKVRNENSKKLGKQINCIHNIPVRGGLFSLQSNTQNAFTEEERAFFEKIGHTLSVGMRRVEDMERMRKVLEHLPYGVSVLDHDGQLKMANPIALGHVSTLCNSNIGDVITQLGSSDLNAILEASLQGETTTIIIRGLSNRFFEAVASTMPDSRGNQIVIVTKEVTEERERNERVQRQYYLAAVGQMAAGVAHDFNNLLTVIMGLTQLMALRDDIPKEVQANLQHIFTQGTRAAQLVRQILDFSRQKDVERTVVDILPFLNETVKMIERVMPANIRFSFNYDPGPFPIYGNLTQLQQILNNICINSQHAMPNGGDLFLSLKRLTNEHVPNNLKDHESWSEWSITDTGAGIPKEVLSQVFEPFFTTKPVGEGTGLGLAQSYEIVQQHGGHISIDSQEGMGTTVRILLPLVDEEPKTIQDVKSQIVSGDGHHVLLVEDDDLLCEVIAKFLESIGYQVNQQSDGQSAVTAFTTEGYKPDIIVSDYDLPNLNGNQMIEALREAGCTVPAVCISGYEPPSDDDPIFTFFDRVMRKPTPMGDLARVLSDLIRTQK